MINPTSETHPTTRWMGEYLSARGPGLVTHWAELQRELPGKLLLVLGCGFDPRMTLAAEALALAGWNSQVEVALLRWGHGPDSSGPQAPLIRANLARLTRLLPDATVRELLVDTAGQSHIISTQTAKRLVAALLNNEQFTHVVVDVSALPRALYFPIVAALLTWHDNEAQGAPRNIHVTVGEDAGLDAAIIDQEIAERAEYLPGFTADLASEGHAYRSKIWVPVLGEAQGEHLRRIYTHVSPNEICPVLPSPAKDPRRADNLVLEYHALLFDQLRVEPRNILYADEQNPFELYRQIARTMHSYESALQPIDGCRFALSAHSSKLMSVGVLLTAYQMRREGHSVGVAHVESVSSDVRFDVSLSIEALTGGSEVFGLWLAGDCYAA